MSIDTVGHVAAPPSSVALKESVKVGSQPADGNNPPGSFQSPQKLSGEIQQVVDDLVRMSHSLYRRLDFQIHRETGEVVVRILDSESGKLIKQVPPEAVLRLHSRIKEAVGLIFDETI